MSSIVPKVSWFVKEKMRKRFRKCRIASVRLRYLMVFNLWNGRSPREIEPILDVHNTTVYRVAKRFCERGEASLWDGREGNGADKLSEALRLIEKLALSQARMENEIAALRNGERIEFKLEPSTPKS